MLLEGDPLNVIISVSTAMLGVVGLSAAAMGYFEAKCSLIIRVVLFAVALGLLYSDLFVNLAALAVMTGVYIWQRQNLITADHVKPESS
jgi:TRAP-type uncharacterized transport system fused permease subunit